MTDDRTPPEGEFIEPRVLGGRYEVGELIGRGGMAEVHVGHDLRLGRSVAIKILRSDLARDTSFLARFRREAQSAAGLNHPSIVAVYDSGEQLHHESGGAPVQVPYIIMEHVEGRTLRDLLNEERVLDPDEAARITAAVLAGLDYAHSKGIVHRDIKPANVMVTRGGAVKVMDFGIARALADTAATMTQTQAVLGTARYLSPEQAQGQDVDARSDLYSTGCLLYELLSGRTPFQGDPVSLVYQHLGEQPQAPSTHQPDLPKALDAITLHALEKTPEARYQSAGAFRDDLVAARTGGRISQDAQDTYNRVLGAAVAGSAMAGGAAMAGDQTEVVGAAPYGQGSEPTMSMVGQAAVPPEDSDEPTDEIPVREERHRGGWLMLGVLGLLALAAVAFVVFEVLGPADEETVQVAVPSVITFTEDEARAAITRVGLVPEVEQRADDTTAGEVIEQNPGPNTMVDEGSTVDLVVSSGPDAIEIPDVEGFSESAARTRLEAEGLTVAGEVQEVDDPEYDAETVIRTDPGAGQEVNPDEEVVLVVASGQVEVPNVVGQDLGTAASDLRDARLSPVTEFRDSAESEPNTVLEQSRSSGDIVDYGTEVVLVVAREAPSTVTETQTQTQTATVTVTPEPTQTQPPEPPEPPASPSDPAEGDNNGVGNGRRGR